MGKRLLQIFVLLFIYNILFCTDTTSLAKTKTINYQEEFPQYLQSAIVGQGIDKNSDGKLSGIEINAVTH